MGGGEEEEEEGHEKEGQERATSSPVARLAYSLKYLINYIHVVSQVDGPYIRVFLGGA